jgi:transcription termination/antitermination protein NusA
MIWNGRTEQPIVESRNFGNWYRETFRWSAVMAVRRKKVEEVTAKPKDPLVIGKEVMKLIDSVAEEKRISREILFGGIEQGIQLAALRHYGVEEGVHVTLDRATGEISARLGEQQLDPETLGRIAAQSAKQVIIQKFREAESDTVYSEYNAKKGDLVMGNVTRVDAGTAIVSLGKTESLLPRSEQIAGESHHVGERVKAVVFEVRKNGNRVKVVLSRAHPDFVKCLFEEEIPEIADRTIDIRAIAREAGYRSKLAVSSVDSKVDCVGACVGVRGSRIKTIIEELNGERIDIVRWNDSLQVLIPNALQPAAISDVFTYPRLGRAIVLVEEDQLSLAIGRRGQNVRLASKLVGLDLEIMTADELAESLERAERWFGQLPHINEDIVQSLIGEGFLSYNELTYIDGKTLTEFTPLSEAQADEVISYAEDYADTMEEAVAEEQRQARATAEADQRAANEAAAQEAAANRANAANPDANGVSGPAAEAAATEPGTSTVTSPDHPVAYHEGPPTDTESVEHAVEQEELRTGEDGELTTPAPGAETTGETA